MSENACSQPRGSGGEAHFAVKLRFNAATLAPASKGENAKGKQIGGRPRLLSQLVEKGWIEPGINVDPRRPGQWVGHSAYGGPGCAGVERNGLRFTLARILPRTRQRLMR